MANLMTSAKAFTSDGVTTCGMERHASAASRAITGLITAAHRKIEMEIAISPVSEIVLARVKAAGSDSCDRALDELLSIRYG